MSYTPKPVDCTIDADASVLAGKTAVVTGGANGIGEAYVRALHAAKVTVVFGDLNQADGEKLERELEGTKFIPTDVTSWPSQLALFTAAAAFSPTGKIHYVIPNAGIAVSDSIFSFEPSGPTEPSFPTINVNLIGALYTVKLALHHFMKQNGTTLTPGDQTHEDTCLVLMGSGAAFLDCPRGPQYAATKWGMRGVMHSLRRTAFYHGTRVNVISPWYVNTKILPKEAFQHVRDSGVEFATTEDAGNVLLRILSDRSINGRSLFLSPRKWAPKGYLDLDIDDYHDDLLQEIQADQLKGAPVEEGLFLPQRW